MTQLGEAQSVKWAWEEVNSRWRFVVFDSESNEMEFFGATLEDGLKNVQAGVLAVFGGIINPQYTFAFGASYTLIFE